MTTRSHDYPFESTNPASEQAGWIVLDQIRTVDKRRLTKRLGAVDRKTVQRVKAVIREMLVD